MEIADPYPSKTYLKGGGWIGNQHRLSHLLPTPQAIYNLEVLIHRRQQITSVFPVGEARGEYKETLS